MIKFENTDVCGFEHAIRGMRNPMNSWDKSDSFCLEIGPDDLALMQKLAKAGTDHRKFLRMIVAYVDITAPLYWWKEFDTYKVGTVANSCSTMHKIAEKEFELDDFSHEHLLGTIDDDVFMVSNVYGDACAATPKTLLQVTRDMLNYYRERYLETKDKAYWWQMIQLLPSSYNQKRTVMLSYEVLANIYKSRQGHKLDEWHDFLDWVDTLPYAKQLIGATNG